MDELNIFQTIKKIDEDGKYTKETFSPSETLAIIALRPFLAPIGARIMQMIDMGINNGKGASVPKGNPNGNE